MAEITVSSKLRYDCYSEKLSAGDFAEMSTAVLIYPHQLFENHPAIRTRDRVFLVEEPLIFANYRFHRQKLIFHRSTMKRYLAEQCPDATYVECGSLAETGDIVDLVVALKCDVVRIVDPCDDWILNRLRVRCSLHQVRLEVLEDPNFLTSRKAMSEYLATEPDKLFFTNFYMWQRKRLKILIQGGKPIGGKWSFDHENRSRLPKDLHVPPLRRPKADSYFEEARQYVRGAFPDAIGDDAFVGYPTSHREARAWLSDFVSERFAQFGPYEDAISSEDGVLFHSVLTPALNVGLLTPKEVYETAIAESSKISINSIEGFVRQIIGWREFVRLVYLRRGRRQRTANFWKFERPMPRAFYDGTTGVDPVDHVIRSVLKSGYCHHIERLMILGNFMLLCEIRPDDVYRWFSEFFIDAYDWVMVPNVYGMSQFADGGSMTTKPYISGSSYVLKMSDFRKGSWCQVWDALYWQFIDKHADYFSTNPRMGVMVKMRDKLGDKIAVHRRMAEEFLSKLS